MGYKRKAKTFVLGFEDEEYKGLEVKCKSLPMGDFLDVSGRFTKEKQTDEDVEAILKAFADSITEWNLEDDNDAQVPATLDGLKSLDLEFVFAMIAAWLGGISGVAGDLGKASTAGESFPEASIPMEAL
jgi:hypothetical protein